MAVPLIAAGAVAAKGGAVAASGGAASAAGGSAAASGGGAATANAGAAGASATGGAASQAGSGSGLSMGQSSSGAPGSSGKGMGGKTEGFGNNLDDRLMRQAADRMSEEDEKKKEERGKQKDLKALQNTQAGGSGKGIAEGGMGQGGMSQGKLISAAAKMLPGGDIGLDIAVVLAGASIMYFPWAFDIMKDDGLCKRNIYRLLAMVFLWAAILILVVYIISFIVTCLRHPFSCGWGVIRGLIWD